MVGKIKKGVPSNPCSMSVVSDDFIFQENITTYNDAETIDINVDLDKKERVKAFVDYLYDNHLLKRIKTWLLTLLK